MKKLMEIFKKFTGIDKLEAATATAIRTIRRFITPLGLRIGEFVREPPAGDDITLRWDVGGNFRGTTDGHTALPNCSRE